MHKHALTTAVTAGILILGACNNDQAGTGNTQAQTSEAQEAAGDKAIAAGIPANSRFLAAAKAAGLDQTLAGPGPYTVLVPADQAFAAAPAGTFDAKPENRAQITGVLTNLILPGTVLAADIDKAIETGKGKAVLATMGGGTVTATKDGGKTVLTDAAGNKASITKADERYTNGVVHHIDAVLMPAARQGTGAAAESNTAG